MEQDKILELLNRVQNGMLSPENAVLELKKSPFEAYENLGYARVDHHRELRQGVSEVIYGAGKTAKQIIGIVRSMLGAGNTNILITRLSAESAAEISGVLPLEYDEGSKVGIVAREKKITAYGTVVVASGGTSDMPVSEEAALTLECLGSRVERLYDVGVSGLHRLLGNLDPIMNASVIVAVAGMEGALASVIGGLASCPVIAVPTSVGYGANFGGLTALLAMLNSCASGVSVVNIDNGFGAGYLASIINHMGGSRA